MKISSLSAREVHGYLSMNISFHEDLSFLIGLNGSGKTTALRLLMALLTPDIKELASISFAHACVVVDNNGVAVVIEALKKDGALEVSIRSGGEEIRSVVLSRAEMELFLDANIGEEGRSPLRDFYVSNSIISEIRGLSTPMFLGLDRRFFAPESVHSEDDDQVRREYVTRRYWPGELPQRGVSASASLMEVNYLTVSRVQKIRASQVILDENLRFDFFRKAFEYKPGDFFSGGQAAAPTKNEIEGYKRKLAQIGTAKEELKLPLSDIQKALDDFFARMTRVISVLDADNMKLAKSKEADGLDKLRGSRKERRYASPRRDEFVPSKEFIEWVINKPQADRVIENLNLINEYVEKRNALKGPLDNFISLVNKFFMQTKKEVHITSSGQLVVRVGSDSSPRTIDALSSGERQILVMLAHLAFNPNLEGSGVFIVDEPELSLHIDWQEKFVDAIREANPSVQIILATHSPAIILDKVYACVSLGGGGE